jgi:hypothetical protein
MILVEVPPVAAFRARRSLRGCVAVGLGVPRFVLLFLAFCGMSLPPIQHVGSADPAERYCIAADLSARTR